MKTVKNKYTTPIIDYLKEYNESGISRLHMPGHKGKGPSFLPEGLREAYHYDITEIGGADNLFDPEGIIRESEENASDIFGAKTFYSPEGSSLAVKAMLYLAYKHYGENSDSQKDDEKPYIIALGMNHKSFFHATELLNIDVVKIGNDTIISDYDLSGTKKRISEITDGKKYKPIGVYVTYPDYFGRTIDIKTLKSALSEMDIPLLVDGAHSAYFKFLDKKKYGEYLHPVDCGADISCTSAHKTLPALTGAAYLHINDSFKDVYPSVKHAMAVFGSTSPSYLIMASLDAMNAMAPEYKNQVSEFCKKCEKLKNDLRNAGFKVEKSDPLRIVVLKDEKFNGRDFASSLKMHKCECECFDEDYVIMMVTPLNDDVDLNRIKEAFLSLKNAPLKNTDCIKGYNCLGNFS